MAYKVSITPTARTTYLQILHFLMDCYGFGVVQRFEKQTQHCVRLIAENPHMFVYLPEFKAHKAIIDRYTSIYYEIYESTIVVHLFWHHRRDPKDMIIKN